MPVKATSPEREVRRVLKAPIGTYNELDAQGRLEHEQWRTRTIERARTGIDDMSKSQARRAVDRLAVDLLRISRLLATAYGTPDLGNKHDPVDELVYIILARRTREGAYQSAYAKLKKRFRSWEDLAAAPTSQIEEVVRFSGLGSR